ncbi:MAG: hypothetical protein U0Y68_04775 [Blastocatellia bacterium]
MWIDESLFPSERNVPTEPKAWAVRDIVTVLGREGLWGVVAIEGTRCIVQEITTKEKIIAEAAHLTAAPNDVVKLYHPKLTLELTLELRNRRIVP